MIELKDEQGNCVRVLCREMCGYVTYTKPHVGCCVYLRNGMYIAVGIEEVPKIDQAIRAAAGILGSASYEVSKEK